MYTFQTKEVYTLKGKGYVFNVQMTKPIAKTELDTWVGTQVEINGREYEVKEIVGLDPKLVMHVKFGVLV